jgi:hypothetical protein
VRKPLVLHTFLFAASPILFLFGHNAASLPVETSELLLPLAASFALALVLLLVFSLILHDRLKAGIAASLFLLLFFLYGGAFTALAKSPAVRELARHRYLMPLWLVLWFLDFWLVARTKRSLHGLTVLLNIIAAGIVITNTAAGLPAFLHNQPRRHVHASTAGTAEPARPDIYYVILDGYARADILKSIYGRDNSRFTDGLKARGFRVAAHSRSNYSQTYLSLASSLNLMLLDSLAARVRSGSGNRVPLTNLIQNNKVMSVLKRHGYTTIAFASGYTGTELTRADIRLAPRWALSEFQNILLGTTPLPPLIEKVMHRSQYDLHRERILFELRNLPQAARARRPVFVFCHILSPHPPFVFGAHGEKVNPSGCFSLTEGGEFQAVDKNRVREEYVENYRNQLEFLSGKVTEMVDRVLAASPRPPVIILQADHGPGSILNWDDPDPDQIAERMAILNACLLPGDTSLFYDSITPVNTFRILFNHLFGAGYRLLPDQSYFSTIAHPYAFYNADSLSRYAAERSAAGEVSLVVFRMPSDTTTDPARYSLALIGLKYSGVRKTIQSLYTKTVAETVTAEQAASLYRQFVRSGELPDLGEHYDTYSGPGPTRKPVTVLYFTAPTRPWPAPARSSKPAQP